MTNERVTIHHMDAGQYVVDYAQRIRRIKESGDEGDAPYYDVVIIDLPDPMMGILSDLYSVEFYRETFAILEPSRGLLVTQATGLLSTKESFWCIEATLRHAATSGADLDRRAGDGRSGDGGWVRPYKAYVPVSNTAAAQSRRHPPVCLVAALCARVFAALGRRRRPLTASCCAVLFCAVCCNFNADCRVGESGAS